MASAVESSSGGPANAVTKAVRAVIQAVKEGITGTEAEPVTMIKTAASRDRERDLLYGLQSDQLYRDTREEK